MNRLAILRFVGLACAASWSLGTAAAPLAAVPDGRSPLEQRTVGGIEIVNAGAGDEEVAALKEIAPQYSLRIVFSNMNGAYAVAERLVVSGARGVRAEVGDAGPWLLMQLPPGTYTLEASFGGRLERRVAHVGRGTTVIEWQTPAAA